MTFVKKIKKNTADSHQTSPGYVLTCLRWSNRDNYRYTNSEDPDFLKTRDPLVIYNDATQVSININKKSTFPQLIAILKGGDINYQTALNPGDFVLANFLNWESDAQRVRDKAHRLEPINEYNDGFKGLYKIQSVVESLTVDPRTGVKMLSYTVTASAFTEFNNVIYYNPAVVSAFKEAGTFIFQSEVSKVFANFLKSKNDIQTILRVLFRIVIGQPLRADSKKDLPEFGSKHFLVPKTLGKLLGRKENFKYASDIYNLIIGVWGDSKSSIVQSTDDVAKGFNPSIKLFSGDTDKKERDTDNIYITNTDIQGNKQVSFQNWNNNRAWSLMQGYLNEVINEMFTTFRVAPDGKIQPTVIVRQKPFTNPYFEAPFGERKQYVTQEPDRIPNTQFLNLPRWELDPHLIKNIKVAKNDALRYNFVQIFTRTIPDNSVLAQDMNIQITQQNFEFDEGDIVRNGLRPYVKTANFDFPGTNKETKKLRAKSWTKLVADWLIGGHLKPSGTITTVGIQDPISVGDNIELDGIVYHIEGIDHIMLISKDGVKKFETKLTVSYGMDKRSSKKGAVYRDMEHTDAHTENIEDYKNNKLRPGISDTQDIRGRVKGEELKETRQESFTPDRLRKPKNDKFED